MIIQVDEMFGKKIVDAGGKILQSTDERIKKCLTKFSQETD